MKNKLLLQAEKKQKLALVILFSLSIFLVLSATMVLIAFGLSFFVKTGFLDDIPDQREGANIVILIMVISSVVLGTFLTSTAVNTLLYPFNVLRKGLNRLAIGDFKTRISYNTPLKNLSFVSVLEESFNSLANELENTEILRSDFINNFSHEFKTPIVSIAGFAKILKNNDLTDEQRKEYLDIIEEESLRLSALATNTLNLTKIENQTILTDITTFNISEQIRNCILILEDKWTKKNLNLKLDFDEYDITGNEEMLKHVWLNLLDNAIKFSTDNGDLEIQIIKITDKMTIAISNYGDVISNSEKERIFDKFYQSDTSHSSEGNGIGLAIVKKVVELHEGEIDVTSTNNKTTFSVTI